MRKAEVYFKNELAGELKQLDDGSFIFHYTTQWLEDSNKRPISLTLPKRIDPYQSPYLFAFFFNMLPEGANKEVVCFHKRIDKDDHFGILLATAKYDTIGAVTIKAIKA
ncbi:MAG: HipA N-terminal domain-containing protein [Marinilabiliaceae bacterium]|nr:HipA N-terminal domain-containing protein [Marinilabiliaceae bacterium]